MLHHWVIRVTCLVVVRDDATSILFDFWIRSRGFVVLRDCFELLIWMSMMRRIFRDVNDAAVCVVVVVVDVVVAFPHVLLLDGSVLKLEHV